MLLAMHLHWRTPGLAAAHSRVPAKRMATALASLALLLLSGASGCGHTSSSASPAGASSADRAEHSETREDELYVLPPVGLAHRTAIDVTYQIARDTGDQRRPLREHVHHIEARSVRLGGNDRGVDALWEHTVETFRTTSPVSLPAGTVIREHSGPEGDRLLVDGRAPDPALASALQRVFPATKHTDPLAGFGMQQEDASTRQPRDASQDATAPAGETEPGSGPTNHRRLTNQSFVLDPSWVAGILAAVEVEAPRNVDAHMNTGDWSEFMEMRCLPLDATAVGTGASMKMELGPNASMQATADIQIRSTMCLPSVRDAVPSWREDRFVLELHEPRVVGGPTLPGGFVVTSTRRVTRSPL